MTNPTRECSANSTTSKIGIFGGNHAFGGRGSIEIPISKITNGRAALMHHGYEAGLVDDDEVFAFVVFLAGGEVVLGQFRRLKTYGN
jgi:hypothetical protein